MKVQGHGQAKVLDATELRWLFEYGLKSERDKALFGICLFTGCRVSEALALKVTDIKGGTIVFRKGITKGRLRTRTVDINPALEAILEAYHPPRSPSGFLFPAGIRGKEGHLTRFAADKVLRTACQRIGVPGVSTHSFRRTALTQMHNAGVPLKHIQEISGHTDLGVLQAYLEVSPQQRKDAVAKIKIGW